MEYEAFVFPPANMHWKFKVPIFVDFCVAFGLASVTCVYSEFSVLFQGECYVSLALLQRHSQTGIRLIKVLSQVFQVMMCSAYDHLFMLL